MRIILLLSWWLSASIACAQVTFNIAVPDNTPANANIYVAGNFNNWDAGNNNWKLTKLGSICSVYSLTVNPSPGVLEYKFTRGTWPTVEGDVNGNYIPNRTLNYSGAPDTVNLTVASWEDLNASYHTFASNTAVLSAGFYMPQLDRNRRIWIQLPIDYYTTNKSYPVIYLQDGQNLFDLVTSFSDEWEVDEAMNTAMADNNYGAILIGIDNGAQYRIDEYCPWNNPQYGGGQGDAYIDFIVETLKPYVDQQFRTLACREYTGIGGSSLGGLISLYGAIREQSVFGKALVFSPAYWINNPQIYNFVNSSGHQENMKIYQVCGNNESTSMVPQMQQMHNLLLSEGFSDSELSYNVIPGGQHAEWFWAEQYPGAYNWCFVPLPVSSNPELTITSNATGVICHNDIVTYSANALPDVTYYWTVTNGTLLSGQGTPTIQVQWTGSQAGSVSVVAQ